MKLQSYSRSASPSSNGSLPQYVMRELGNVKATFDRIVAQCPVSASFADGYLTITLPSGTYRIAAEAK